MDEGYFKASPETQSASLNPGPPPTTVLSGADTGVNRTEYEKTP
jgi:hypothetical protein